MIPLKYNIRNLIVRWKTTALTALGFVLVVGLLVVMLAFVQGLNELAKKSGPAGNVIILRDGANDEMFSDLALKEPLWELYKNREQVLPNKDQQDGKMASRELYSIITQELPPAKERARPTYRFLQVRGLEEPKVSGDVHQLKLKKGDWLKPTGDEVVMGEGIARLLGMEIGSIFEPRSPLKWKVVGILDSRGSPFDSEIWAKREDVGRYFGKDSNDQSFYTAIVVSTSDQKSAEDYAATIQGKTQVRVSAMPERKYYEEMSKSNSMFQGAALFIAIIMAVGGMFGLMNTMFAAVSQRIKDIGVLRILGYTRWQILVSFLLESLLLSIVGGGLGILMGYLFNSVELTSFVTSGSPGSGKTVVFSMVVNRMVLLYAIGFTLGMGLLGGFLPAWSAMRTRPLESLR